MRHLKRFAVAMLVVAMILSTAGFAAAAPTDIVGEPCEEAVEYLVGLGVVAGYPDGTFKPDRTLTRAEVAKIIVLAKLGAQGEQMAGYLKGAYSFSDVPATHWASGYIKLAQNLGIINGYPDGTYKPENNVTYAELIKMLVEAAGIPAGAGEWPTNYLTPAQAAGITGAMTAGWTAGAPATRGDMAMGTAFTVKEVPNPTTGKTLGQSVFGESAVATLTVTPAVANVGVGQGITFAVAAKDADDNAVTVTPTFTTSDMAYSAVSTGGLFVASKAGTYIVTVNADGKTATATVNVFGVATGLKITPATGEVVANGANSITVTVEVVDANGFLVATDNTTEVTIDYADDGDNGAVDLPGTKTKTVSGGKATFKLTSTLTSDRTDVIEAYPADEDSTLTSATCEITTVEQIATTIKLTARPTAISANSRTWTTVKAQVIDQSGEDMEYGVYNLTWQLSGPGVWEDATTAAKVRATSVTGYDEWDVGSIQGNAGTITVTVSGEGLPTATVNIESVIAGVPAALKLEVQDNTLVSNEGDDTITFYAVLVDNQGRPTVSPYDVNLTIKFDDADSNVLSYYGLDQDGAATILAGQTSSGEITIINNAATNGYIGGTAVGATSGTRTLKVTGAEVGGGTRTFSKQTFSITVTPGDVEYYSTSPNVSTSANAPQTIYLPYGAATASFTVQLRDAAYNAVPEADVEVEVELDGGTLPYSVTVNGKKLTEANQTVTAKTDSSGKAVFSVVAQGYVGDDFLFYVDVDGMDRWSADHDTTVTYEIADKIATRVELSFRSGPALTDAQVSSIRADGTDLYIHVVTKDAFGNTVPNQKVRVTFSNSGDNLDINGVTVAGVVLQKFVAGARVVVRTDGDGHAAFAIKGADAGSFTVTATAMQVATTVNVSRSFRTLAGTAFAGFGVQTAAGGDAEGLEAEAGEPVGLRIFWTDAGGNPIPSTDAAKVLYAVGGVNPDYRLVVKEDGVTLTEGTHYEFRTSTTGTAQPSIGINSGTVYRTIYLVTYNDYEDLEITVIPIP